MPYYRRNVYILSVTVFLASLSWQQIMPFLPMFLKQIGGGGRHLNMWVAVVFATQALAAIIMQPFWGKLGDTHGRKPMIIRAGICLAGVYFLMSLCHAPWQLVVCRFLNGALTGFIPGSFALIATNTPEEEAPKAMATVQAASNVGQILGPVIGTALAVALGYRGSMRLSGAAVLISTLVVLWLVKEPNKVAMIEKTSLIEDFGIALRSKVQSSVMLIVMLSWAYGTAIAPFLILHLNTLDMSAPSWLLTVTRALHLPSLNHWLPAVIFSLPAAAFVFTARRWTEVGSKKGYAWTIMVGMIGGGLGAVALFFTHSIWLFALIYLTTGICTATLGPSIAAITCTKVEESFRGRAYGIQQSAGTIGSLLAPLAAGFISTTWGRPWIFPFIGVLFLTGALAFRRMAGRWGKEA